MAKSEDERQNFVREYLENPNLAEIKLRFPNVTLRTMQRWVKQLKQKGHLNAGKSPGRKAKHSDREVRQLVRTAHQNPHLSIPKVALLADFEASRGTASKILKSKGIQSFVALKRPKLTAAHIRNRKNWADQKHTMSLEDWKNWTFSDESTIELDCAEGTKRFLITRNQRHEPQFIQGKRQQGGGKLMIWSRVSWDGPGPLIFVEGTMDGPKYLRLLRRHVLDHCIDKMGENGEPHVFMDDGASCHSCNLVADFCDEKGILRPYWPPNSPDMNPIEWVWGNLKNWLTAKRASPKNLDELKVLIQRFWDELTVEYIQKLYATMPKRLAELKRVRGKNTKF